MANMQSLIDVQESINVDDIENESDKVKSSLSNIFLLLQENSPNSTRTTDETGDDDLWESANSSAKIKARKTLNPFDDLELKRMNLEAELGIKYVPRFEPICIIIFKSIGSSHFRKNKLCTYSNCLG